MEILKGNQIYFKKFKISNQNDKIVLYIRILHYKLILQVYRVTFAIKHQT